MGEVGVVGAMVNPMMSTCQHHAPTHAFVSPLLRRANEGSRTIRGRGSNGRIRKRAGGNELPQTQARL